MNLLIKITFLLWVSVTVQAESNETMVLESKQSIKHFAKQLKTELQQGMKQGGPVKAINVCYNAAEQVSKQVSQQYGWTIARTALKFRNINNSPDIWEKKVLLDFEARKQLGEAIAQLEFSEIINTENQATFRYMKAIPTQGICLSCHGDNLVPTVSERLKQLYPEDKATGFQMGDIRGAFTISRKIN